MKAGREVGRVLDSSIHFREKLCARSQGDSEKGFGKSLEEVLSRDFTMFGTGLMSIELPHPRLSGTF